MEKSEQLQQTIKDLGSVIKKVELGTTFQELPSELQLAMVSYADSQARAHINKMIRDGELNVPDSAYKEKLVCVIGSAMVYGFCCGHNWVAKFPTLWETEGKLYV